MRINRLRGQHHKTPFEGTRRRTLLGDVNGLVAENGLHPTKHNRKKLQTLKTRPFFCAPSARTLERATTERPPDAPRLPSATSEPPRRRAPLPTPIHPAPGPEQRRDAVASALNSTAGPSPGLKPPGEGGGGAGGRRHPGGVLPAGLGTERGGWARRRPGKPPAARRGARGGCPPRMAPDAAGGPRLTSQQAERKEAASDVIAYL